LAFDKYLLQDSQVNMHSLIEISLSGLNDKTAPSIISLFDRWGRGGAVVEQVPDVHGISTVKTYLLPEDEDSLRQIEIGLALLHQVQPASPADNAAPPRQSPQPLIRFLSETDWAEAWKTGYDVFRVGQRLVIKPTWRGYAPQPGDLIIELDPGMAFGSGLHPTTRFCLEALEDYLQPGAVVLDIGTGSGVLAIAAARLGASRVLALDTDPLAVRVARENVALNQVESIVRVERGTVQVENCILGNRGIGESGNRGDVVVANILAETIVELTPALVTHLATEGTLITSGIIQDRVEAVMDALRQNGLSLVERRDDGEWVALIAGTKT
jgi:ribosomal protein L11 methyltransferase